MAEYLRKFAADYSETPANLRRWLREIRELDEHVSQLSKEVDDYCKRLDAKNAQKGSAEEDLEIRNKIIRMHALSDLKLKIAQQAYDEIDGKVTKMEGYLHDVQEEIEQSKARTQKGGSRKKSRTEEAEENVPPVDEQSKKLEKAFRDFNNLVKYCKCHKSVEEEGDRMVMCEGEECAIEWFHLKCVGLKSEPPSGTAWYCHECRKKMKKT